MHHRWHKGGGGTRPGWGGYQQVEHPQPKPKLGGTAPYNRSCGIEVNPQSKLTKEEYILRISEELSHDTSVLSNMSSRKEGVPGQMKPNCRPK